MVEFRDAKLADARGIGELLVRSWRAVYRGLMPDEVLAGLSVDDREKFWAGVLTNRPPRTDMVVATSAGAVVGFAATGPPLVAADGDDPTLGDLYALYLDPKIWRLGVGTDLHSVALDRLRSRGFAHAGLWVLGTNERALGFYASAGWTDTGRTQVDTRIEGVELHERRLHRDLGGGLLG
ncbi:Ribosomal protein S18 acetylase RimI [Amycolatopsis xylanica]|uniref:Ribosomal protein S18 acetylase RimI n=1 Tax=Amycolatopsis xylanica TaxID=589385 RepID=A0A1H2U0Q9_9PSEU|nr:GNAT family N-acetyltransferase [Amycolatopsis xylanica]SDW49641.1 Ribosomal protein S18 acetylase RimI [Amycolatopsis xylanica]